MTKLLWLLACLAAGCGGDDGGGLFGEVEDAGLMGEADAMVGTGGGGAASTGTLPDAKPCAADTECISGTCLELSNGEGYCATPCTDAPCARGECISEERFPEPVCATFGDLGGRCGEWGKCRDGVCNAVQYEDGGIEPLCR